MGILVLSRMSGIHSSSRLAKRSMSIVVIAFCSGFAGSGCDVRGCIVRDCFARRRVGPAASRFFAWLRSTSGNCNMSCDVILQISSSHLMQLTM
jgi:hypothetical protein